MAEFENNKSSLFIKQIIFSDGTVLELEENTIVVITGPNNVGKSQALRDVESKFRSSNAKTKVVKEIVIEQEGDLIDESVINDKFELNANGQYLSWNSHIFNSAEEIQNINLHLNDPMRSLFIKRASTESRLVDSNPIDRRSKHDAHPIYKVFKSDAIEQKISKYFYKAFKQNLIINRNDFLNVQFHVGNGPDKSRYTMNQQDDYYEIIEKLPQLVNQGDGMRSFASVLLDTFTSFYTVMLIDEPEAFLHPPQAKVLGQMLAENNPVNRQLFVATHSQDFLQGLLDAGGNIVVIRMDREDDINTVSILHNSEIRAMWNRPLLKYSNILNGLFHEKVIVCESDYDCLFYQALMVGVCEKEKMDLPSIMFTHCGGKTRMKEVVKALKSVNVPVIAICDFDILNKSQILKELIMAFEMDWNDLYLDGMKIVYDTMNTKPDSWDNIKKIGKAGFWGEAPKAYEKVEKKCKDAGMFIVPVGEMEDFDKTISEQKKEWVFSVLEKYDLTNEPKLEMARCFVKDILRNNING